MKTKFRNIMRLLSMAALAMVGAIMTGCDNEDNAVEQQNARTVILTTTISLDGDGGTQTRALTAAGVKTFAKKDQIAVFYMSTEDTWVKKAVSVELIDEDISNDGKTAKFTVTLTNPKSEGDLRYVYPAAMALDNNWLSETNSDKTVNYDALNTQDGSLNSLAANLDLAIFDGKLTADAKLPATASLTNRLAICEFDINDGSTNITSGITLLNVANGDDRYTVRHTAAAGPIYVAMRPVTTGDISIFAAVGTTDYRKTVPSPTLVAGNMYPVNLTMVADPAGSKALERLTENYQAQNGDVFKGMLLNNVKISIANEAEVTLAGVSINADRKWDSDEHAGITCEGDAIITLADGTTNTVQGFNNNYPGIFVPEDKTLTIQGGTAGTGALIASRNGSAPGIGSNYMEGCGNITITGGHITAYGGSDSPGIGCRSTGGNITITGGTIKATGGEHGAGIGSGDHGSVNSITISGGTITATGGEGGAGIGSGDCGSCGEDIIINQGAGLTLTSVTATRGSDNASPIGIGKEGIVNGNILFFGKGVPSEDKYLDDDFYFHITNSGATWTIDKIDPNE